MNNVNTLWTEKYRPQSLNDYYMSDTQYAIINDWITALINNLPDAKPFLILHGTAGIGKTTIAHLILQKYNYEIIECNASDTRSKGQIHDSLGGIAKVSICIDEHNKFKKTGLILDEIDGVNDLAGVQEIINIVICKKKTKKNKLQSPKKKASKTSGIPSIYPIHPITRIPSIPSIYPIHPITTSMSYNSFYWLCPVICTSNNIKTKPIQLLTKYSIILNLDVPTYNNSLKLINKIIINENLTITQHMKDDIIKNANGDYRQIIMLLYQLQIPITTTIATATSATTSAISATSATSATIINNKLLNTNKPQENIGITPLENINYFITHNMPLETLSYISSGDTTLFFLNFYANIISIIYAIQHKQPYKNKLFTKKHNEYLLNYYNILYKIYNYISIADIINNNFFVNKQWELLQYVDMFSIAIPTTILYNINIKQSKNNTKAQTIKNTQTIQNTQTTQLYINNFDLCHHSQYNYMSCEHSMLKKKLNIDYINTYEKNIINIYYNLKRFQYTQPIQYTQSIQPMQPIRRTSRSYNTHHIDTNTTPDNIYQHTIIDKTYIKILNKIDDLLS